MLQDSFGRPVSSLRVQVNTTCNFKCFFCHMEGTGIQANQLSRDEIIRIIKVAAKLGINKVKFTGGEPTLRSDIVDIVRETRAIVSGEISMTTNGTRLTAIATELKKAGLDRINISMHSIDPGAFEFITGMDALDRVVEGIKAAQRAGLNPVKVNFVALKGINEDQIWKMIENSADNDYTLQIIEYEVPRELEQSDDFRKYHYPLDSLESELSTRSIRTEHNSLHDRPLFNVPVSDGTAKVEIVRPMHSYHFCDNCTRMRVTSLGELKPCLMRSDNYTSVFGASRKHHTDGDIEKAFIQATDKREPYWRREEINENHVLCDTS
ncbi:MAG: GTP 3',8-cyclase MoaA [Thermoplasmata archaeon]